MWVFLPTGVLLVLFSIQNEAASIAPSAILSSGDIQGRKRETTTPISLEYKPIKPSYLGSGSNVAQIIPPGQPWPASAAGYANFSQVNPGVPSTNSITNDIPLLQSSPTTSNLINLDMSNPNTNFPEALEKVLAPSLTNIGITKQQQTIPISLNITPPPNANMNFVQSLQTAVRTAINKLAPFAGTSLQIAITKSSSGAIVNVKAYLSVIIPAATKVVPILPASTVPEIDLRKTSSDLPESLRNILSKELSQKGYNPDSKSVQKFALSFSVLPPEGATQDYVKSYILAPLQKALKIVAPRSAITAVSVKTQESNKKILRQTVNLNLQVEPAVEFQINDDVEELPEVTLNEPVSNLVSKIVKTLQDDVMKIAPVNSGNGKTLAVPFKITPPAGATEQQIKDTYVTPLSQVLSKLDPTGKIFKLTQKSLPNGDIVLLIHINIPPNTSVVSPATTTVKSPAELITSSTPAPISINNRNSFPEEEDELPEVPQEVSESAEATEKPIPPNAYKTATVDLISPTASINSIKKVLKDELSPASNPIDDENSKVLAIPFKMKPPLGATLKQIEEKVVDPIGKLLTQLEPTGNVVTSQTESLPNGDVESVIYFKVPSVKNSKTFQDLSDQIQFPQPSTKKTEEEPVTKAPQVQTTPETEIEVHPYKNAVITPPVDVKNINFQVIHDDIQKTIDGINNDQTEIVGVPFVMNKNQDNFLYQEALKKLLEITVPSGKILPEIRKKELPNGDIQKTLYIEKPTVVSTKPTEKNIEVITKPSVQNENIESPETNEQPLNLPESTVIAPAINLQNIDNIKGDLEKAVDEAKKSADENTQFLALPFNVPTPPSPFVQLGLQQMLRMLLPGKILPERQTRVLPNGQEQLVFVYKLPEETKNIAEVATVPAVITTKPTEVNIEKFTEPTVQNKNAESISPEKVTEPLNLPENAVLTPPITLQDIKVDKIKDEVEKRIDDVEKSKEQPDVIALPFNIPFKKSLLLEVGLQKLLQTILPGDVLPNRQNRVLPNGDTQTVFLYKVPKKEITTTEKVALPEETTIKPTERKVEEIPEPSVQNKNAEEVAEPLNLPKNAVLTPPIDVKNVKFEAIPNEVQERIDNVRKSGNNEPEILALPFNIPLQNSYFLQIGLQRMLESVLPGEILPEPQSRALPNGETQLVFLYKMPDEKNPPENFVEPAEAAEDVNLDEPGAKLPEEVETALVKAISTISSVPENLNKPAVIKFNVYAPLDNTPSQNQEIVNSVSSQLEKLEPEGKVVTAKVNQNPKNTEADGLVELAIQSVASSKTVQDLNNAISIPTIDINVPELKLADAIPTLLQRGLKKAGQLEPDSSQLFNLNFRLNPFNTKGSVSEILQALKTVDPTGEVVSYKITSGADGLEYLKVLYLIPTLKDSLLYNKIKAKEPEVIFESFVTVDSRNPRLGLLEKVISEIGAAEDEVKGAQKRQLVVLPLDFKFTNSEGMSDSQVSDVISRTLPVIQSYISQILPEGKVLSVKTVTPPNTDDVILQILVKTPYEPDATIVIEEPRPKQIVTTPKPRGLFGLFGL